VPRSVHAVPRCLLRRPRQPASEHARRLCGDARSKRQAPQRAAALLRCFARRVLLPLFACLRSPSYIFLMSRVRACDVRCFRRVF